MAPQEKQRICIYQLDLTMDLAIVIGSEGKGIRPLVKKKCDRLFSIPMKGPISSFNASVSGGMILYEVMRQRNTLLEKERRRMINRSTDPGKNLGDRIHPNRFRRDPCLRSPGSSQGKG